MPHVTEEIWSQLPDRESRLIVAPWPEADERFAADVDALERVRTPPRSRAEAASSSSSRATTRRIFDIVVQPAQLPVNGSRETRSRALRKEVARSEGMLGNDRFVANAPADVVEGEREKLERYRRELDALGG